MKSIDEAEARTRLDDLLDEAQQQSIVIRRQDRDIAILLSMDEYERLRAATVGGFLALRNEVAHEAIAAGLSITLIAAFRQHSRSPASPIVTRTI